MTLDELLKRLREATGADLELNMRVHLACGFDAGKPSTGTLTHWHKYGLFCVEKGEKTDPLHFCYGFVGNKEIPLYTASPDAAIALVEKMLPDCSWNVESEQCYDKGTIRPRFIARIRAQSSPRLHVAATFATPALALLIALLEALSAKGEPKP